MAKRKGLSTEVSRVTKVFYVLDQGTKMRKPGPI